MFFDAHTHHFSKKNAVVNVFYQDYEKIREVQFCSLALHPWHVGDIDKNLIFEPEKFAAKNILAVGETGLDKVVSADFELQKGIFRQHIGIAKKIKKPLILHAVRAHAEILAMLRGEKFDMPFLFHGFNQNENIFNICRSEKNAYFSFGTALFHQKSNAANALQNLPPEKVLFETDDSSTEIEQVYEKAAEILATDISILQKQTAENFAVFFKI